VKFHVQPIWFIFPLICIFCSPAIAKETVDLMGDWHGSYSAAFPADHDPHDETSVKIDMVLKVYKQEGNLIWVENRWRPQGEETWKSEFGTGVLPDWESGAVHIVENDPRPGVGSTGVFQGKLRGQKLHLIYLGVGGGISFSVTLERD
jgi:hypothetical protein